LNGKVDQPNRTVAEWVRCMIINVRHPKEDWCYAAEHYADIYCDMLRSDVGIPPEEAWYGTGSLYKGMHMWGCRLIVPTRETRKSKDRANGGFFYGYAKSRNLLR
jgi:hypothetical protein